MIDKNRSKVMGKKEKFYVGIFAFIGVVFGVMFGPLMNPMKPVVYSVICAVIFGVTNAIVGYKLMLKFEGKGKR